jgi:hypothetical protein
LLYLPGIGIYYLAQRENKQKAFKPWEIAIAALIVLISIYAFVQLLNGNISY